MDEDIFLGNIQGLLQKGKWTLSLEEASAMGHIYQEVIRRRKALNELKVKDHEPMQPVKKTKNKQATEANA